MNHPAGQSSNHRAAVDTIDPTSTAGDARPLSEVPGFDKDNFSARWAAARLAALRSAVPALENHADVEEMQLLAIVPAAQRDAVLRAVYDNSRQLALSAVRYLGVTWQVSDFPYGLADASPCLTGEWTTPAASASVLTRNGCEAAKICGSLACDYWREAIDGLTTGIGLSERFARHASVGHDDAACIDVWFDEGIGPSQASARWAPVPAAVASGMASVVREAAHGQAVLTLLGVAEGVLFYRLESVKKAAVCGSALQIWRHRITSAAKALNLSVKDVSPTAVLSHEP